MKKPWLLLLLFLGIKVILQLLAIDPVYELQRDEFLHLDLGKHPDWGFLTVPPLTGLISKVILLPGGSVFWVKLFPVLFGLMLLYLVWKTVDILDGGIAAKALAMSGVTFSVLVRINTLYQPNSLDFLMWTLVFYFLVHYILSRQPRWIYFTGLSLAIGFLNKYNVGFLMAGLLPAILISNERKLFFSKHLYLAGGLALLLVSPNLVWQFKNGFPVWHHLQELAATQLVHVNRFDFLKEQLFFFLASLPVILSALASFFIYPPFRKFLVFFWGFVFTLALFVFLRAKSYYAIGLYPVMIAFGSVYLERLFSSGRKRWLMMIAIMLPPLFFIPLFRYVHPVMTPEEIIQHKPLFDRIGLTRWEDGKLHAIPQDFADMLGWKELAHLVDSAFLMSEDKERTIVHCDNYGQAGAVNFYSEIPGVKAYSMNADYINWYPLDQFEIKNAILVKDVWDEDVNREREKPFFEEVRYIGEIKNPFAREKGTRVFLLRNARVAVNEILRQEIKERKQKQRLM